ncbi:MAG: FadR/GntR family transcriptional regulator [Planctomycetota bacterium]|jgi:DNA-binding FadR family transcriptional regulator
MQLERPILSKLVRDYIVTSKLRSGDALPSEGQIAKELGISRNSVREAVKALELKQTPFLHQEKGLLYLSITAKDCKRLM